ncbi:MAG: hypothetical protein OXI43_10790 [Candidatus Poribacteria bacterium]|nr:hypothetical protein [Candidatus Poribacteria bacterium]
MYILQIKIFVVNIPQAKAWRFDGSVKIELNQVNKTLGQKDFARIDRLCNASQQIATKLQMCYT